MGHLHGDQMMMKELASKSNSKLRFLKRAMAFTVAVQAMSISCEGYELFTNRDGCQVILSDEATCGPHSIGGYGILASNPIRGTGLWRATQTELEHYFPGTALETETSPLDLPIRSLAIDPTDGRFFAQTDDNLITFDPVTGTAEIIASLNWELWDTLAFDKQGTLHGVQYRPRNVSSILQIDKLTGSTTEIGTVGIRIQGVAFHPTTDEMYTISFARSDSDYPEGYGIFRVYRNTFEPEFLGKAIIRSGGLEFASVPEPRGAAILLLPMMLLIHLRKLSQR